MYTENPALIKGKGVKRIDLGGYMILNSDCEKFFEQEKVRRVFGK